MMQRGLILFLSLCAGLYVLICLGAWLFQERLVYFPGPAPTANPSDVGLRYEDVELLTEDGVRLHGWLLGEGSRAAVLVSHGNGGTIEHRLELARELVDMGFAVLLYDYRGYGRSEGRTTEEGTYLDARAAYDWLAERGFEPRRIALYGESLGAAVAIDLALHREVAALAIESAFTSLVDMGALAYPWLPARLLARIEYDNRSKVPRLSVPLLAAHSPDDEIVPIEQGRALFALAAEPKRWLETSGGHNAGGLFADPEGLAELERFLWQHLR